MFILAMGQSYSIMRLKPLVRLDFQNRQLKLTAIDKSIAL